MEGPLPPYRFRAALLSRGLAPATRTMAPRGIALPPLLELQKLALQLGAAEVGMEDF
jgi:hypothetical protein